MMLNRFFDVEIDFDFDKVLEKSNYIKFFMFSILLHEFFQNTPTLKKDINENLDLDLKTFSLND